MTRRKLLKIQTEKGFCTTRLNSEDIHHPIRIQNQSMECQAFRANDQSIYFSYNVLTRKTGITKKKGIT